LQSLNFNNQAAPSSRGDTESFYDKPIKGPRRRINRHGRGRAFYILFYRYPSSSKPTWQTLFAEADCRHEKAQRRRRFCPAPEMCRAAAWPSHPLRLAGLQIA
jgi:hypothetical protein